VAAGSSQPMHAYLVNEDENKQFFIAVLMNERDNDQWTVYTAWGFTDSHTVRGEKEYNGGKGGDKFSGQRNAEAYAGAILKTKQGDGFKVRPNDDVEGERPMWWEQCVERGGERYGGKAPVTKPVGLSKTKSPPPVSTRDITTLKERMAAKVKIEAGKAKIAIKQDGSQDSEPEQPKRVIQPRFGFAPRKQP